MSRTVVVSDPLVRANVLEALAGAGAPVGVYACIQSESSISVEFDAARTAPELIDVLIEVACTYVPAAAPLPAGIDEVTRLAAQGLGDFEFEPARIIEMHLG